MQIDGISTDLDDLRAQLAALQKSVDEKLSADNSAALAALQKKFANMMTAQESQGKQLDKAWGYITADEAAEEVVQGAFDNEANTAEEDEMYQQLLKRTNAIVRHCLCRVLPLPFVAKTAPLPCDATAFVAKTVPFPAHCPGWVAALEEPDERPARAGEHRERLP